MTVLACWFAFPLVLALVSAGLGLLGEWAGRFRLPTSLLLPWGFALLVLLTTLATLSGSTAGLATPGVVVLAVAGLVLGGRRRKWALSRPGIAAALGVFAVAAAPVVLSGEATFAGYTQLDDISTFLAFAARAIDHGRDLAGLAQSTYEATLAVNFSSGYPLGAIVPLPAVSPLVGQDIAWLWQPYMTYMLVMLALPLWALARPVVRDARLRAVVVFLAAQPALLYAYAQQGSVKELAAAALIAFAAAAGAELLRASTGRWRLVIPLAVTCASLVCVLSAGAVAYIAPLAGVVVVAALVPVLARPGWRGRLMEALRSRAAVLAVAAVVVLAAVVVAVSVTSKFLPGATALLKSKIDIGNLFHPLDWKQAFGIWPAGDFRTGIGDGKPLAFVLIAVVGVAGLVGAGWTLRRRLLGPALLGATAIVALVGLSTYGQSPWVEAKALAIASPAVVFLAALGASMLIESRRLRVIGVLALAGIGYGVLWSNWLAYRDVKLAPRDRLEELAKIGDKFAGQGPTMINEYEPYGARYFLRKTDPEAPAELRRRVVPLRGNNAGLGKNQWAPLDEFLLPAVLTYRTIVVRRSPAESRPPVQYTLRSSGRYYDVWQRPEQPRERIVTYSIFGDQQNAAALPPCGLVQQLAASARRSGARMVAAVRAPAVIGDLATAQRPPSWPATSGPAQLYPNEPGSARLSVTVPAGGTHDIWVQGSFARGLSVSVDGARVGSTRNELSFTGQWIRFGARELSAGRHAIELHYPGGSLRPGSGQQPETVGPVAVVPRTPRAGLLDVAPADARSLCTKPLDWLEVVTG